MASQSEFGILSTRKYMLKKSLKDGLKIERGRKTKKKHVNQKDNNF